MTNITSMLKSAQVKRQWILVDVDNKILGKVATEIATRLIGKQKKEYTPHIDAGDYVVVINAEKVAVSGKKEINKLYQHHTGQPGGLRTKTLGEVRVAHPERLINSAVMNMLPKNKLRAERMKRLKVFAGSEHPYQSQISK